MFWSLGQSKGYVFAATREQLIWKSIPLSRSAAAQRVASFRKGLGVDDTEIFDLAQAFELYRDLFGALDELIKDKRHWILVQSDVLSALPMHLLLTESPAMTAKSREDLAAYKDAPWLMKRNATSRSSVGLRLPRRSGLRRSVLRRPRRWSVLAIRSSMPSGNPPARAASRSMAVPYTSFWSGAGVDRAKLATALPRLADTADELTTIAGTLNVPRSDIHLRKEASETLVKKLNLSEFKIVYFATHGLVAGDVKGLAEPSLALTIPGNRRISTTVSSHPARWRNSS